MENLRKLLLIVLTLCMGSAVYAQLGADGFYRIQSQSSKKYMSLQSDEGRAISSGGVTTSYDLSAMVMMDEERTISDPASVLK